VALAWVVVRSVARVPAAAARGRLGTATAAVFALAAMLALTTTWTFERVSGHAPAAAQLDALRRLSKERALIAMDLRRMRSTHRDAVPALLRIRPDVSQAPGGAGRNDRPLYSVGAVPAGIYRLRFDLAGTGGWIMIGIGRDQFALRTDPLTVAQQPIDIYFPVDVRALLVRVDEDARRNVRGLTIEPQRIVAPSERLADDYARRAVHYAGAIAYFLDDRSFPEPEAFWVGGARSSSIVLQPDQRRSAATLQLRNGPVENTVALQSGGWRDELRLGPGEERRIDVPLDLNRGATLLQFTTTAGFTPSAVDPRSRDDRYLGVWVKIGSN
jgi:hypothetical protein